MIHVLYSSENAFRTLPRGTKKNLNEICTYKGAKIENFITAVGQVILYYAANEHKLRNGRT